MRRFLSTGSARSAKLAEGSARGATARKIGWLCRALPGSPYSPRPNGRGFFFAFGPEYAVQFFFRSPSQRFLAACRWSLCLPFAKMQERKVQGATFAGSAAPDSKRLAKETTMQKSRRLFFAFAAASALGAATLLTGCHHWPHRPPPPGGGRLGGSGRPGPGSGGPSGRPGPGFGGRPGPGFGGRPGPR